MDYAQDKTEFGFIKHSRENNAKYVQIANLFKIFYQSLLPGSFNIIMK